MKRMVVGITGASGSLYAVELVRALLDASVEVHLIISELGGQVLAHELEIAQVSVSEMFAAMKGKSGMEGRVTIHPVTNMFAPPASGSFPVDAMVIIPCSMKTLSSVANGYTTNLLERAADVTLKERRPLVLVTRECPLSHVHLSNMLKAHEAGATIMPASPGFYHHPKSIGELVEFMIVRVLDHLGIATPCAKRWGDLNIDPKEPS